MPDTLIGLILFVVFLSPGLVFFFVRDRRVPSRELSPLRETGAILLTGLACNVVVLGLFALARAILHPDKTPDVDRLLTDGRTYFTEASAFLSWWALGLLATAILLGFLLGFLPLVKFGTIRFASAWYQMFHGAEERKVYCGCTLDDGSWVGGALKSFSTEVEETDDRDLVIEPPLTYRTKAMEKPETLEQVTYVIISAKHLVRLDVTRLKTPLPG
jgi:hypothetical protein